MLNLSITSFSLLRYTFFSIALILAFKFFVFYSLRIFRTAYGANYRKTIIIGSNSSTLELENFFESKKELGYFLSKTFDTKKNFSLASVFKYISQKNIDEIYCSVDELNNNSIREIIDYCDNNFKTLKFLPKRENLYYKKLDFHNYGLSTVQAFRKTPIERGTIYYFAKRIFDICFSLAVIILLLSWLIPIISILIKLDSKGPVFFSQIRNGYKYREFKCIKFRSMVVNSKADILTATKGDVRVTRIGKFLRKTSLDEMPQFVNVLFGDMSVVGPRPHMIKENTKYAKSIDRFMLRHTVKPGITGLAQINGYRGEIEEVEDIINRIKYDVVVFVLSWLTPIIALFIKKESDGPVFFKQIRNGINYEEFSCLKFRSMIVNDNAHKLQATKGDTRVTKIGAFLRKTSLDEMPQFINVLLGDMSVVGPRPHMIKENDKYYKTVDKYMLRHVIKPGITGLAQVSGYRGEVEKESDIVNRIKFDIYYLENWSILLDVKIILRTILNSIKGEDKAY